MQYKAFGGRAPTGPAGELQRSPDAVTVIRGMEGWGEEEERVGDKSGEEKER